MREESQSDDEWAHMSRPKKWCVGQHGRGVPLKEATGHSLHVAPLLFTLVLPLSPRGLRVPVPASRCPTSLPATVPLQSQVHGGQGGFELLLPASCWAAEEGGDSRRHACRVLPTSTVARLAKNMLHPAAGGALLLAAHRRGAAVNSCLLVE